MARHAKPPPPRPAVPEDLLDIPGAVRERLRLAVVEIARRKEKLTARLLRSEAQCDAVAVTRVMQAYKAGRMPPIYQPWDTSPRPPRPEPVDGEPPPGEDEPPKPHDDAVELNRKTELAKARRMWWQSKIDRLKALQAEGRLVPKEEVTAEHAQMVTRARARLLALPGSVSSVLAAETDPRRIESYLDERLRAALEELAREVSG